MQLYQRGRRWWFDGRTEGLGRGPLIPSGARLATDDEQVAKVLLGKMIKAHAVRQRAGVSSRPTSLPDLAKKLTKELQTQVSASHLANLTTDFAKVISSSSLGGKMVDEITRQDVLEYMDERRSRDSAPAPATLRREVMALSRLMAAAVNRELRSDNPCYRIGAPRPTEPGPKPLEPEQAAILLHLALNIRTKNRLLGPIVATLLYTGARIGEALLLDVPDVRFGEGVMLVPTLKQRKSRPPRRRLRLWGHLAEILGPVAESAKQRRELFASASGRRLKGIRRAFATLLDTAGKHGVRAELDVHDLRDTYATMRLGMVERDHSGNLVPITMQQVQHELGHKSIAVTERHYGGLPTKRIGEILDYRLFLPKKLRTG
jgi:integrase